jgi:auxin efflux carrier family protein
LFAPALQTVVDLVTELPWELSLLLGIFRCSAEVAVMLGGATLVLQAVTLGASLLPKRGSMNLRTLLIPATRVEFRQLISTSVVRLLLMPLIGLASVHHLSNWGMLPASAACKMALLVQSCMPSAQNLVLLANLREETKELAPVMAQLLLRQYLLAIVPTTLWISVFMSYVGA